MHSAEVEEDNDDSDEEDMKTNLFKAAEHDVLLLKSILFFNSQLQK
ncbi:putative Ubiquitin protein ligase [Daphnia magna]|uniref:Putative Ubiquitin protein ligase n=1 Tax=Daphnia magna TaxID=35525 RepID=A0A164J6R3_9CRUS|nr:putative Ubiquitin protein ligase [Daphnia magna]